MELKAGNEDPSLSVVVQPHYGELSLYCRLIYVKTRNKMIPNGNFPCVIKKIKSSQSLTRFSKNKHINKTKHTNKIKIK